jgi:hypothetical protein
MLCKHGFCFRFQYLTCLIIDYLFPGSIRRVHMLPFISSWDNLIMKSGR